MIHMLQILALPLTVLASPRNWLEMQILTPELLNLKHGSGVQQSVLTSLLGDSGYTRDL